MTFRTLATLAAFAVAGCGDSTGVTLLDLTGTWTATEFTFISVADPDVTFDFVEAGGSATLQINADGSTQMTINLAGDNDSDSGTISVTGQTVTLEVDGDASTGTIARNGDRLTINLTTGVEFDFDNNGTDDPATFRGVFEKQ